MRKFLLAVLVAVIAAFLGVGLAFASVHSRMSHAAVSGGSVLLGSTAVASVSDGGRGSSEAFGYTASVSGVAANLGAYLTSKTGVALGLYADKASKPGSLLDSCSLASNTAGWVSCSLSKGVAVVSGTRYWIVAYAGSASKTISYRDTGSGGSNLDYSGTALSSPYVTNHQWSSNPASLYVGGVASTSSSTTSTTSSTSSTTSTTSTSSSTSTTTTSSTTTAPPGACAGAPGSKTPDFAALSACGFPTPSSTGVPAGTTLTPVAQAALPAGATYSSGELDITGSNITLSALSIPGGVHINGVNDTIKNSTIAGEVLVYNGDDNTTLDHDEITAHSSTDGSVNGASGHLVTITNSYLHDNCTGLLGAKLDVENDYIITDSSACAGNGAHVEDLYIASGSNEGPILIQHNTLLNPLDQTAAVFLDDHAGGCGNSNVTINGNILAGGDYPQYGDNNSDCSTNIKVTNNRFSRLYFPDGGVFGPDAENTAATTFTQNVWDDTGAAAPENAG